MAGRKDPVPPREIVALPSVGKPTQVAGIARLLLKTYRKNLARLTAPPCQQEEQMTSPSDSTSDSE